MNRAPCFAVESNFLSRFHSTRNIIERARAVATEIQWSRYNMFAFYSPLIRCFDLNRWLFHFIFEFLSDFMSQLKNYRPMSKQKRIASLLFHCQINKIYWNCIWSLNSHQSINVDLSDVSLFNHLDSRVERIMLIGENETQSIRIEINYYAWSWGQT